MKNIYYAKSKLPNGKQPTVKEHDDLVSHHAAEYGLPLGMSETARLTGKFHDFGKYSDSFQEVLSGIKTGIDHAICGATLLYNNISSRMQKRYYPVMEAIYGHHNGLFEIGMMKDNLKDNYKYEITAKSQKKSALSGEKEYKEAYECFKHDNPNYTFPEIECPPDTIEIIISNS